jgi:hypothetical protein
LTNATIRQTDKSLTAPMQTKKSSPWISLSTSRVDSTELSRGWLEREEPKGMV